MEVDVVDKEKVTETGTEEEEKEPEKSKTEEAKEDETGDPAKSAGPSETSDADNGE